MRALILSDIHANLTALKAVLEDAGSFDQLWCLGDIVGYGPDPNECTALIRSMSLLKCVKGNHDAAILGEIDLVSFNYEARASLMWLMNQLEADHLHWLSTIEERLEFDDITMVHGSPRNPIWEYLMDPISAGENMSAFSTQLCFVGHTHVPGVFQQHGDNMKSTRYVAMTDGSEFYPENKVIINPGSVGQPRDNDPRSAYAIFDDQANRLEFHRVFYDIEQVQRRILAAGLPRRHASRLKNGW